MVNMNGYTNSSGGSDDDGDSFKIKIVTNTYFNGVNKNDTS